MDLNHVVIGGRLAVPPEITPEPDGRRRMRLLIVVRGSDPPRVDLIPVTIWNPPDVGPLEIGTRAYVSGSLHRRFSERGGSSRIEVVADHISTCPPAAELIDM